MTFHQILKLKKDYRLLLNELYLFDKTGAIIAGGFTLFISIALLGSKFYVKHNKKEKNKLKKKKGKQQNTSKFIDFFTKKRDIAFFPDDIFEMDEKKCLIQHIWFCH